MAGADYLACADCGDRMFYDADSGMRDALEAQYGTVSILCPKCIVALKESRDDLRNKRIQAVKDLLRARMRVRETMCREAKLLQFMWIFLHAFILAGDSMRATASWALEELNSFQPEPYYYEEDREKMQALRELAGTGDGE